eukprot:CAMPEP_0176170348 /NCGR_PEP_ID=MMETSP0120_2-20121206/87212_1 /TAXON_ID=160619 /ORGANISM="Kryptoperidinium foliaceum, Strain CCMP 1326" /LENGTH=46 /DNA_ID= /DNA_START= /DNA_END= /DNA_ORIENTATION=
MPTGASTTFTMILYARRGDGDCLASEDLRFIETQLIDSFNQQKQSV